MYSTALRDRNPPPNIAIIITTKIIICFVAYPNLPMNISRNPFRIFCVQICW